MAATMTIRQARVDEFDQVMDFYTRMIDEMRGTDFDVCWEHGVHPSPEFLRTSIKAGEVYVGLVDEGSSGDDGSHIASAMVLNGEGFGGYEQVPWRVRAAPNEVLVVHVLATLPVYHGRGFARAMVEACIGIARAAGKKVVRLDVFPSNVRARCLYESCGFSDAGTYMLTYDNADEGGADFVMYEYVL